MKDNAYYSEDSDPSEHIYDSIVSFSYKGESTVFFQELAMDNLSANSLIAFPEFPNSFDKMVIDKDKIYLKVFYTKYKNQNWFPSYKSALLKSQIEKKLLNTTSQG